MARKRKEPVLDPPLNMSDDLMDMAVVTSGCMKATSDDDGFGVFTIATEVGYYSFLINDEVANEMVQALRDFIAGSVPAMDEADE